MHLAEEGVHVKYSISQSTISGSPDVEAFTLVSTLPGSVIIWEPRVEAPPGYLVCLSCRIGLFFFPPVNPSGKFSGSFDSQHPCNPSECNKGSLQSNGKEVFTSYFVACRIGSSTCLEHCCA
jgi:hypothetical protein